MIQVLRTATLPWASLDAVDEKYEDAHLPFPARETVEKCMSCPYERCINCLASSAKERGTGRPCGRPRKAAKQESGQCALWEIAERMDTVIEILESKN